MKANGETDMGKVYAIATAKAKQVAESVGLSESLTEAILTQLLESKQATEVKIDSDQEDLYTHKTDEEMNCTDSDKGSNK